MERKIVKYGEYVISVDIQKTEEYYKNFLKTDTQANRNFVEYCNTMSEEERVFFRSLAIDPQCCNIEHAGVSKKGDCPCGGYFLFCGDYVEYPPEELITVDALVKNDFEYSRNDNRINIGIFQFDFQVPAYEVNDIPDDMPDGFICVRFWCEHMKWLLNEKPEEAMYEPPKFWEIHRKIKEYFAAKALKKKLIEDEKGEWVGLFEKLKIGYAELSAKELRTHKTMWINHFAPQDGKRNEIKKLCVENRKYTPFLWHLFSYEYVDAKTEAEAKKAYDNHDKEDCVIINNASDFAYIVRNANGLDSRCLDELIDITVTSSHFEWTYCKTHEEYIGPFFYSR